MDTSADFDEDKDTTEDVDTAADLDVDTTAALDEDTADLDEDKAEDTAPAAEPEVTANAETAVPAAGDVTGEDPDRDEPELDEPAHPADPHAAGVMTLTPLSAREDVSGAEGLGTVDLFADEDDEDTAGDLDIATDPESLAVGDDTDDTDDADDIDDIDGTDDTDDTAQPVDANETTAEDVDGLDTDPESLAEGEDADAATADEVDGETATDDSDAKHAEGVPATEFITSAGLAGLVSGGAHGRKDPKLPEFYDGEGVDHTSHIAKSDMPERDTETPDEEPYLVHDDRPEVADYDRGYDESDLPEFPFYTDRKWRIWGGIAGILAAAGAGIMTWWAVDHFSNDSSNTDGENTPVTQTIAPPPQDGEGAVDGDDLREQLVTDTETPEEDKDKDKSKERATVTETVDAPPREEERDEPEPDQPEDNPAEREDNPAPEPPAEQPAQPVAPEQPAPAPRPQTQPNPQPQPSPNEDEDPIFGNWRN